MNFSLGNKYAGFEVSAYSVDGGTWQGGSAGDSISYNNELRIRFSRNTCDFTFDVNYPVDANLEYSHGKSSNKPVTLLYGALLNQYGSTTDEEGVTNWYYGVPDVVNNVTATNVLTGPDNYTFEGWYEDKSCTVPFNFNSTITSNKIVYAKWTPNKFIIRIDPNGGEIDHVNHGGYSGFGTRTVTIDGQSYTYDFTSINSTYSKYPLTNAPFYDEKFQTYIRSSFGTTLTMYTPERRFIPMNDRVAAEYPGTVYYYVNYQWRPSDGASGIYNDVRSSLYLTSDELQDFYNLYRNIVIYSLGRLPDSNEGMQLLDFGTWKSLYVSSTKYRLKNDNETWTFLGWYKTPINEDGTMGTEETMPYNVSDPVTGSFKLTAHWRLDGGYSIQYIPKNIMGDGAEINGTMASWRDPIDESLSYADGADTQIYKAPTGLTKDNTPITDDSVIFRGWALVSKTGTDADPVYTPLEVDSAGRITTYYYPSDDYTVNAANAGADSTIYFQAVYQYQEKSDRRPDVTNLTIDANGGYINTTDSSELPALNYPGNHSINNDSNLITIGGESHPTQILFGDFQTSAAIHMYRYATNAEHSGIQDAHQFFAHQDEYFLLGFVDEEKKTSHGYIADYAADSVIAVTKSDDKTVFAVWEPMVYITFKNETPIDIDGDGTIGGNDFSGRPLEFTISPTGSDAEALEVINLKNGMYERSPLTSYTVRVPVNGTVTLAFPKGAEKDITITGTNDLGIGKKIIWNTSVTVDGTTFDTADGVTTEYSHTVKEDGALVSHTHALAHGEKDNTEPRDFSLTERLITDEKGLTVTFTAMQVDYALLLKDNYNGDGTGGGYQEYDYTQPQVETGEGEPTEQLLTYPGTRIGYEFLGWDPNPNFDPETDGDPDYPAPAALEEEANFKIASLKEFFADATYQEGDTFVKDLYAVWKSNNKAKYVYVYKDVPLPGDQQEEFTFNVAISADYKPTGSSPVQHIGNTGSFTLSHGQYAVLYTTTSPEEGWIQTQVTVYNANGSQDTVQSVVTIRGAALNVMTNNGVLDSLSFSVTEDTDAAAVPSSVAARYTTTNDVIATASGATLNTSDGKTLSWENPDAGGTVVFTNIRKTHDITVAKTLVNNTGSSGRFTFNASYEEVRTSGTVTINLGEFTVANGSSSVLEKIPSGTRLTITELGTNLNNYITTAKKLNEESLTVASSSESSGGETVYKRTVTIDSVDDADTITFTNTLKSFPVKFVLVDQDDNTTINGLFSLSTSTGSLGTNLYANASAAAPNTSVFYTSNKFWVDTYTLSQDVIPENYLGLTEDVTLTVTGDGIRSSNELVTITGNEDEGFVVSVKNWKTVGVTVNVGLLDPIVNQRTFAFSGTYILGGQTYDLDRNPINEGDTPVSFSVTTTSTVDGSEIPANKTVLRIPVHAESLTIYEDTSVVTIAPQTIGDTYTIQYKYNDDEKTSGDSHSSYIWQSPFDVNSSDSSLIFYNERITKEITVKKTVLADSTDPAMADNYTIHFFIKRGDVAIETYKVYDDPDDDSNDLNTDSEGKVSFVLEHGKSFTLKFPVGADVYVSEVLSDNQTADDMMPFICMPGGSDNLLIGSSAVFKLTGPTENKEIRIFNVRAICKVTSGEGTLLYYLAEGGSTLDTSDDIYAPAIYSTIHGAFDDINGVKLYSKSGSGASAVYTVYTAKDYQVQMLRDYNVPTTDLVTVNAGYDLTFTTASTEATDGYSFRRTDEYNGEGADEFTVDELASSVGKAVLRRENSTDKQDAFFTVSTSTATIPTTFKMSDLIIDGHGATLNDNVKGGCLTAYNSDVTIDRCVIYNFVADQGGAVFTSGDSLTVKDSVFDSCISGKSGSGNGGGAINTAANTLSITGTRDSATGTGTTVFRNCSAVHQGGAVYQYGLDKQMTISGSIFAECTSRSGGAVEADVTTVNVSDSLFIHCTAKKNNNGGNSGGINNYFGTNQSDVPDTGSNFTVTGCTFQGCQGEETGGALRSLALEVEVTDCTFEDFTDNTDPANPVICHNSAKYGGGAAFDGTNSSVTVKGSTFTNCTATERGGGIYSAAATLTVQDNSGTQTNITGCSAKNGGGVYAAGSSTTVTETTLSTCTATSGNGGGIYMTNDGSISGASQILYCTATDNGGGVYSGNEVTLAGTTTITGHETLTDQSAKNASNGGGVYAASVILNDTVTIEKCKASSNGGGIYTVNGGSFGGTSKKPGSIKYCTASGGNGQGGGIYMDAGTFTVEANTSIKGYETGSELLIAKQGGGIFVNTGTLTMAGSLENCKANNGGGIYINKESSVELRGTVSSCKTAENGNGGGVYVNADASKSSTLEMTGGAIQYCEAYASDDKTNGKGGAIFVTGAKASVSISGGSISNNKCNGYGGGAIRVEEGAQVTISGDDTTISDNFNYGSYERCGGAIGIKKGTVRIQSGTISGNYATGSGTGTNNVVRGGAIFVDGNSQLYITGSAIITGNYADATTSGGFAYGGAISVKSGGIVNLSGGTISGNYVTAVTTANAKGAGIYLPENAALNIFDNPSFGGADTDEYGSFTDDSGNVLQTTINAKNGSKTYTKARQDIYIAGYSKSNVASVNVTGNITSGNGAIWVWAEAGTSNHAIGDHIHEGDQFAMITAESGVTDSSLAAFRNARIDTDTGATSSAFYGVRSEKSGEENYVIWGTIGGADVSFRKVDGFGTALAGAEFVMYDTYEHAASGGTEGQIAITPETDSTVAGKPNAVKSDENGDVKFRAPVGIYYMKETAVPTGYTLNTNVYIILVGSANVTAPSTQPVSGDWSASGVFGSLAPDYSDVQTVINNQRGTYINGKYEKDSAIFLIDGNSAHTETYEKAAAIPDIAKYGIMNTAGSRNVVLRKVDSDNMPVPDAVFEILRNDHTPVSSTDINGATTTSFTSGANGVYFIDTLPFGTYYLHEKTIPSGYQEVTAGNDGNWFILTVNEDGVGYKETSSSEIVNTINPIPTKPY